ncbi:MAG: 50S ribosomal protein L23 [bacterium]|nr:50S ribosomal protein L23 [bacterium]
MAILDIFKKKPAEVKVAAKKIEKPENIKKPPAAVQPKAARKPKKILGEAYKVLAKPHVTEKASYLASKNQYIFEVFPRSNKKQVKKAVEDVYGVDVADVHIINIHSKRMRLGRTEGWSSGYKKAIVKIKEGQKIEVLPR